MSRVENPWEYSAPSLVKTAKEEEIYRRDYREPDAFSAHSTAFVDGHYNRWRLQSALGYVSPEAFEQAWRTIISFCYPRETSTRR
jgi:putative transposase